MWAKKSIWCIVVIIRNEGEISSRLRQVSFFKSYSLESNANGASVFILRIICLFYCFRDATCTFVQFCGSLICCCRYVSFASQDFSISIPLTFNLVVAVNL